MNPHIVDWLLRNSKFCLAKCLNSASFAKNQAYNEVLAKRTCWMKGLLDDGEDEGDDELEDANPVDGRPPSGG